MQTPLIKPHTLQLENEIKMEPNDLFYAHPDLASAGLTSEGRFCVYGECYGTLD